MALQTSEKNRAVFQIAVDFISKAKDGIFNTKELREEFDRLKIRDRYRHVYTFLVTLKKLDYIYPVGRTMGTIDYQRAKADDGNWREIILTEIIN